MLTVERVRNAANILPWFTSDFESWSLQLGSNAPMRVADGVNHDVLAQEVSNWIEMASATQTLTNRLTEKFETEELDFEEPIDPNGDVADSIESAENKLKDVLEQCRALIREFSSSSQESDATARFVKQMSEFEELLRLNIGGLQELRWAILVNDGIQEPTTGRRFTSGKDLLEAHLKAS